MDIEDSKNLLTHLAELDPVYAVQGQDKLQSRAETWHGILKDRDYATCIQVVDVHHSGANAKPLRVGDINAMARASEPRPIPASRADDAERRERACREDACRCTHTECRDGWMDRPEDLGTYTKNGVVYDSPVKRCPQCAKALVERTGRVL